MMNGVGTTALLVAAIRGQETKRADRLFADPYADRLAGEAGRSALAAYRAAAGPGVPTIEVRTRYYDEALLAACADGVRQIVVLAAGMDARAYRLPFLEGTRYFELDQKEMIALKSDALAGETCGVLRVALATNLAYDFTPLLLENDFDKNARTVWLVEGLLQYLNDEGVDAIMARIDALSAPRSLLLFDVLNKALLASPITAQALKFMQQLGAPWTFAVDDPASLIGPRGWDVAVSESAVLGNAWQRWPFPAIPPNVPGIPRGYLVTATKRSL